ncbi:LamG-like jellyroll fold domain-containing protein [Terrimonas alba]|uniref:LamG-like jellyroll fold domain-containing protein n=1 Tax=Terrimonas alba TaxID=3349636 RepID=UPI0035F4E3AC
MRFPRFFGITGFLFSFSLSSAQQPVYINSFEKAEKYNTVTGKFGTALNLSQSAAIRTVIKETCSLPTDKKSFSVSVWARADKNLGQSYSIIQSLTKKAGTIHGWKIGVQANGAWFWSLDDGKLHYDYYPTPKRQAINDGNWHQVTFSYDREKEEVWLYYDGNNVAIIYVPGINKVSGDDLLIGGDSAGDFGEWETFNGYIDEIRIYDEVLTPQFVLKDGGFSQNKNGVANYNGSVSVMNYNIWHGGRETGKETGVSRIVDIIKNSGADIISMQETYGSGPAIADALGYYFYLRSSNLSIMSRFPILETTDGYSSFYNGGALIRLANNKKILFFTNWLNYPLDYWDILEKSKPIDKSDWLKQQGNVNTKRLSEILTRIKPYLEITDSLPLIFCGDFNSGSHLDWIESTKHLNNGYAMSFPTSMLMQQSGFEDSFREIHPDPLKERGITWSPAFPNAFRDRIDYIYYKGKQLKPTRSFTINTHPVKYPSDHAAVVTVFNY